MTHAVDYFRLGTYLLTYMKCASPAVKQLYTNEIFIRLTATGDSKHADLAMEKTIKHVHGKVGKAERAGMDKMVEFVCEDIPNEAPEALLVKGVRTKSGRDTTSKSRSHGWLRDKSPLIKGFDLIYNGVQIWHHTNEPIIGKGSKGKLLYAKPNSYDLP